MKHKYLRLSLISTQIEASGNGPVIIANFNVPVDPGSSTFMARVVSTAESQHAAAIVIEMNTPGGYLSDMLDIITSITDANATGIPTYTLSCLTVLALQLAAT